MDLRLQPGFLGTGANLTADLTLLAYIFLIVPSMLVGYFFARRKMFVPHHKLTMTTIILFNWVLILFLMLVSYRGAVAPYVPERLPQLFYLLPTLHLITGAIAQILGTYLVIRMWFEKQLPAWFKVKNIKRPMRITLSLWLVTAALGGAIYVAWYSAAPATAGEGEAPIATPEVTQEAEALRTPVETPEVETTSEAEADAASAPVETPEVETTSEAEADDAAAPLATEEADGDDSSS